MDMALAKIGPLFITGINLMVPIVIDSLAKWRKFNTYNDQTEATFKKVVLLSFFNIAVIQMLVFFKVNIPFLNHFNILDGKFTDFNSGWYN
jgi:hypothetical protein